MVRIRSGWLVAIVALSLGVGTACKKSDDKKGESPTTADKMSEKMPGMPGAADKGAASGDDLSLLPVDSEMVIGINFAQLQQSALWKQVAPKSKDKMAKNLSDIKAACGFDPLDAFKSMSIGIKNVGGGKPDGAIVIHGLEKDKVWGCLDKAQGRARAVTRTRAVPSFTVRLWRSGCWGFVPVTERCHGPSCVSGRCCAATTWKPRPG